MGLNRPRRRLADARLAVGEDRALAAAPAAASVRHSRPRIPNRRVMDAILLVLRTGMQWDALRVTGVCNSSTGLPPLPGGEQAGVFTRSGARGYLLRPGGQASIGTSCPATGP